MIDEPEALANLCAEPLSATAAVIIAAAIGALSALVGSFLAQRSADERYRKQVARDDRLHKQRIEREDRLRFCQEKRLIYAKYIRLIAEVSLDIQGGQMVEEKRHEAAQLFSEIELLGGKKMIKQARNLWDHSEKVRKFGPTESTNLPSREFTLELNKLIEEFTDTARDEINPA